MIAVVAAVLLVPPAAPPQRATALPACPNNELRPATTRRVPRAGPHKLNEEPPAHQLYAVLRVEDGCTKPVLVNDRVIGGARG